MEYQMSYAFLAFSNPFSTYKKTKKQKKVLFVATSIVKLGIRHTVYVTFVFMNSGPNLLWSETPPWL